MRKKAVYFIVVPALIIVLVLYLFLDRWITAGLEYAGEKANGVKVEIEQLKLTISPPGFRWDRLQVADKHDAWRNIFETGKVQVAVNPGQLLRGKYIVESIEVSDFILGTRRTTDGQLPIETQMPSHGTGDSTLAGVAQQGLLNTTPQQAAAPQSQPKTKINVDSLVKAADLQSLTAIDSLKAQTLNASKQWDASLADLKSSRSKLADVGTDLKSINPAQIKGADQVLHAITTVDNDFKTVGDVSKGLDGRAGTIEAEASKLSMSVSDLDQIAGRDFQHLMSLANISNLNASGIARSLVGKAMVDRVVSYLHYIDVTRAIVGKYPPPAKTPDPPRMKGQDVTFPVERLYPKFWIQKVHLLGGTDSAAHPDFIRASGEIRDVTNDQSATSVPTVVALAGMQQGKRAMTFNALMDRMKATPNDEFSASLSGVPLSELKLGSENFLPATVTNARVSTTVKVTVPGDQFNLQLTLTIADFKLHYAADPKNAVDTIVRSVLDAVHEFEVTVSVWRRNGAVDCSFETDLDNPIAEKLKGIVGQEIANLQNDLRKKLDARIGPKRKEFEDLLSSKSQAATKEIADIRSLADQQTETLDSKKKELTNRLESEKKGQLQDALKGLLKK